MHYFFMCLDPRGLIDGLSCAAQGYQLMGSPFCIQSIATDIENQYQKISSSKPVASLRLGILLNNFTQFVS
jgi:hypothetical protein